MLGLVRGQITVLDCSPMPQEIKAAALIVGGARLAETLLHQQPEAFLQELGQVFRKPNGKRYLGCVILVPNDL